MWHWLINLGFYGMIAIELLLSYKSGKMPSYNEMSIIIILGIISIKFDIEGKGK